MSAALVDAKSKMITGLQLFTAGLSAYIQALPEDFPAAGLKAANAVSASGDEDIETCNFEQAAKMLGVSSQTVRRRCACGEIEYTTDPRTKSRRPIVRSIRNYFHKRKGVSKDGREQTARVG